MVSCHCPAQRALCLTRTALQVWGRNYGQKADIWAAGVSLYWLYTGKYPLYDNPEDITELEVRVHACVRVYALLCFANQVSRILGGADVS